MEFIITVNSEHMNLSAQLGRRFGEGCEAIARTVDLFLTLDGCCSATIRTISSQNELTQFGIV